jgi:predicted NAD/FAD-binding protein
LVFNQRTYPRLIRLFEELNVPVAKSDMSFSASIPQANHEYLEWSGTNIDTLFAQRKNLLKPSFLKMVADIVRFNKLCTQLAKKNKFEDMNLSVGEFIKKHRFGDSFTNWYFLPMVGAIWSCSVEQMLAFPIATMIRFCHNHGLIQISDRPQWMTVQGGSREYVKRIVAAIESSGGQFIRESVSAVTRANGKVQINTTSSTSEFDHVVFASHSDQTKQLLSDISTDEVAILGAVSYQQNRVILHTDKKLLPKNKKCWAAWNYSSSKAHGSKAKQVCVHYLINQLQPLPKEWEDQAVIVSLNPITQPQKETIRAEIQYAHPVFDQAAIEAQANLPLIQGIRNTWFCGAWTGYGFHEDGLRSGELVAEAIHEILHQPHRQNLSTHELS